ncbi:hypothetical protein GCM10029964_069170 [Kibdelosporangium lantanae]
MSLYRLDSVIRACEPATLLCATIRMVWSWKAGPPVVMLGDQALTREPYAWASAAGTDTAIPAARRTPRTLLRLPLNPDIPLLTRRFIR